MRFYERSRLNSSSRIAVITGGGTAVGAAVALALAEESTSIYLAGRRLEALEPSTRSGQSPSACGQRSTRMAFAC
jgi:NADP-dependent 3-hydroxy acid dehydrogenase YdfG